MLIVFATVLVQVYRMSYNSCVMLQGYTAALNYRPLDNTTEVHTLGIFYIELE